MTETGAKAMAAPTPGDPTGKGIFQCLDGDDCQRELYDYSNARLYAFLMRSLGEEYAHIIPDESAGGPAHADGLRCWRVLHLRHAERSDSSEAYWLGAFMRARFESTGTRHSAANIRTYTRRLQELKSPASLQEEK